MSQSRHTDRSVFAAQLAATRADLVSVTRFTRHEIDDIFTDEEAPVVADMISTLRAARAEHEQLTALAANISPWGVVILKLLRTAGGLPI